MMDPKASLGPKMFTVDKKTEFSSNEKADLEYIFEKAYSANIMVILELYLRNVVFVSMSSLLLLCALNYAN